MLVYDTQRKDLPIDALHALFVQAGWADENTPEELYCFFNRPFLGADFVVSAWDGERLVGCVRALSDGAVRNVVYDLVVEREYRGRGIGSELLRRLMQRCPRGEWLLQTEEHIVPFYEKMGFRRYAQPVLYRPMDYADAADVEGGNTQ